MSRALPSWMYKDPMEVLQHKQEAALKKSCNGCKYEFKMKFQSSEVMGCDKHRRHGRKCELFKGIK